MKTCRFAGLHTIWTLGWRLIFPLLIAIPVQAQDWQAFPLRENGSIPVWTVAGPFPNGQPYKHGPGCFGYLNDFLAGIGGEGYCEPSAGDRVDTGDGGSVVWSPAFSDSSGLLDFINVLGVEKDIPGVVYSFCRITSPAEQEALALIRSNDGVRVWINGEEVHSLHRGRGVDEGEADRVPLTLLAGENNFLVKVDQGAGGWGQLVLLRAPDGGVLAGVSAAIQTSKPLRERFWSASLRTTDLVARTPDGPRQILVAEVVSGGLAEVSCTLVADDAPEPIVLPIGDLPLGEHEVELLVPPLEAPAEARVIFRSASDEVLLDSVSLSPPRHWTVDFVQHTHTDIGYTRPQAELLPDFLAQIDAALDYCDATDGYPPEAQFKWTCEAAWPVREYLRQRPAAQIERLRRRVAEGRIEVTGLFLNLLEIPDDSLMAASLQPLREIQGAGIPVRTAMQNDVPGVAWCLTDYLPDLGVKYLVMGVNNDLTPRPFDRPTAFWWESPSGKKLLTWRPDHYHTGNNLRIHLGDRNVFQERVIEYLDSLKSLDYPFDRVAIQYSGMQIDNSPPALDGVEMIRQWNDAFYWPRLNSATAGEFPAYVEAEHGDELATYRGAWPNWWNFGHAFAFVETAQARKTQVARNSTLALLSMGRLLGEPIPESAQRLLSLLDEDLLFFDEHTFGAQENFVRPGAENSVVQWGQKIEHIWDAVKTSAQLRDVAWATLDPHIARADIPTLAVANTLPWERSGSLEIYIGHELAHPDQYPSFVDRERGTVVPSALVRSRFEGSYWRLRVNGVPPMGIKVIEIRAGGPTRPEATPDSANETALENEYYRIEISSMSGAITRLYDKVIDREWVASDRPWDLGQVVFDKLEDEHFSDRASYEARSERSSVRDVTVTRLPATPLWESLRITAEHDNLISSQEQPGLVVELRLPKGEKRVDLHYTMHRRYLNRPNAMYVAFPFAPQDGVFTYEAQGGLVTPGLNQLPGSSADWHTIQNFVALRSKDAQIVLSCDEIPLVQFGEINMGKWQYEAEVRHPHVYSWVFDDYWTYGFQGNKECVFQWQYSLTSAAGAGNDLASRFGQSVRTPLVAKVYPPTVRRQGAPALSTLRLGSASIALLNARPSLDDGSIVLHLREVSGQPAALDLAGLPEGWRASAYSNALGQEIERISEPVTFKPNEALFIRLER